MAHTPGPWEVEEIKTDTSGLVIQRFINTVKNDPQLKAPLGVVTRFVTIETVEGQTPYAGVYIREDDAWLIRAAPDLLEAAKAALQGLTEIARQENKRTGYTPDYPCAKALRKAIIRAEGT